MGFQSYSEPIKLLATKMALEGQPLDTINQTLRTSISLVSIWRWKNLYTRTNSVVKDPNGYMVRGRPHVLSDELLAVLFEIVTNNPSIYLDEIQKIIVRLADVPISKATISRELHFRLGLSHLVARGVHSAQSLEDRTAYMRRVGNIPPEFFVFIDESGIRGRDTLRLKSWAPKGGRSVRQQRDNDQDHWTILPAVCERGMIAGVVHEGPVERVHVELFLERNLLPVMNRYPAVNSVLVLDNARIHHGGLIEQLCRDAGVLLVYLPAYSPDMNPIENCFHSMKSQLRRDGIWFQVADLGEYILMTAAKVMTRKLLQPLIAFCGYATPAYWVQFNSDVDH